MHAGWCAEMLQGMRLKSFNLKFWTLTDMVSTFASFLVGRWGTHEASENKHSLSYAPLWISAFSHRCCDFRVGVLVQLLFDWKVNLALAPEDEQRTLSFELTQPARELCSLRSFRFHSLKQTVWCELTNQVTRDDEASIELCLPLHVNHICHRRRDLDVHCDVHRARWSLRLDSRFVSSDWILEEHQSIHWNSHPTRSYRQLTHLSIDFQLDIRGEIIFLFARCLEQAEAQLNLNQILGLRLISEISVHCNVRSLLGCQMKVILKVKSESKPSIGSRQAHPYCSFLLASLTVGHKRWRLQKCSENVVERQLL